MPPKKNDKGEGGTSKSLVWNPPMDAALVDAFLNQFNMGLKVNGTFTTKAYDNIVEELSKAFNFKIEKSQVKSRWKILKKNFSEAYDIFKNGMSGFTIDPTTKVWMAEPEVWEELIKVKPHARMYMNTPVPYYEKMVIVYGQDRATGDHSVTASGLRKRSHEIAIEDFADSTNEFNPTTSQFSNQSPMNYGDDEIHVVSHSPSDFASRPPHGSSGSNKKSKKSDDKAGDVGEIKDAIEKVANAIRSSGELLAKKAPMSPNEIYQLLVDLEFQPPLLHSIYSKLIMNVDLLKAVLGYPMERRKEFLLSGVLGDLTKFTM